MVTWGEDIPGCVGWKASSGGDPQGFVQTVNLHISHSDSVHPVASTLGFL